MSSALLPLLTLTLATTALVGAAASLCVGLLLPGIDRLTRWLSPRHQARLWLVLGALPLVLGIVALGVSFLPAFGLGHDHCLVHGGHHPHLCPKHLESSPGVVLSVLALLLTLRLTFAAVSVLRTALISRRTARSLLEASEREGDAWVFPSEVPQAFVLGMLRPRVHLSRGLLDCGERAVDSVLSHERVHAQRRDLFWRALFRVSSSGHLPGLGESLYRRLTRSQELAADAEASGQHPQRRLDLAEALLLLSRQRTDVGPALGFTDGDLPERIRCLLEDPSTPPAWPPRLLVTLLLTLPLGLGLGHHFVHHTLESLLGALS